MVECETETSMLKIKILNEIKDGENKSGNWKKICKGVKYELFTVNYNIEIDDDVMRITTKRPQGCTKKDKFKMIKNYIDFLSVGEYSSDRRTACLCPSNPGSIFWALFWAYVHEFDRGGIRKSIDAFKHSASKSKKNIVFSSDSNWMKNGIISFTISNQN